jgi:outer membrane protein assembly factor BamD (BamD/ComL family)
MTSVKSPKTSASKKKSKPELSEEEKQELEERANQIREQQAENQLALAKLFLENKKPDIALRRLKEIVTDYSGSKAATEAKCLVKKMSK